MRRRSTSLKLETVFTSTPLKHTLIWGNPIQQPRQLLSLLRRVSRWMAFLGCLGLATSAGARDHWTEINIGPYYVDTDGDSARARDTVTRLEQIRWVLGNLLEEKDLQPRWPIRILL